MALNAVSWNGLDTGGIYVDDLGSSPSNHEMTCMMGGHTEWSDATTSHFASIKVGAGNQLKGVGKLSQRQIPPERLHLDLVHFLRRHETT